MSPLNVWSAVNREALVYRVLDAMHVGGVVCTAKAKEVISSAYLVVGLEVFSGVVVVDEAEVEGQDTL